MELQRILVVDDQLVTLLLVESVLEQANYEVWTASSGEDALEIIKRRGVPHLAITDIHMPPGMDGFAFCQKAHELVDELIVLRQIPLHLVQG